jgi:hypothetical protein
MTSTLSSFQPKHTLLSFHSIALPAPMPKVTPDLLEIGS